MYYFYGFVPMLAMCLGGLLASCYHFNAKFMSAAQHLSAGIVLAVVACEFVPSFIGYPGLLVPTWGFIIGMLVMLIVKVISENSRQQKLTNSFAIVPLGIIIAIALDIFIDGMLMGVGFASSQKAGQLITFSLSIEIFFLGVSLVLSCKKYGVSRNQAIQCVFVTSLFVVAGFFLIKSILSYLNSFWLIGFEAFGIAALLYLAVEELLVDAHDVAVDLPWMTAPLFCGFLIVMVLEKI